MNGRQRWLGVGLWVTAVLFSVSAMMFQERTGPTKEKRGSFELLGQEYDFAVTRSGSSAEDARVAIPNPGNGVTGSLHFKRYKTDDRLTAVPLRGEGEELVAELPRQPAAGKLEYAITLATRDGSRIRVPDQDESVIIRFKDPVPAYFLAPHIACMVLVILFGIRAGLSALVQPSTMVRYAWISLGIMTLGGMILGPIVQKYAFGALWTGFPLGYDLTDNKTLLMWLAWLLACATLLRRWALGETLKRAAIVGATVVMMVVYLIPHSARGSELDYSQVDEGVAPEEAVTQGR
jgi:hypothetical protein